MSQQRAPSVRPPQGAVGGLLSLAGRVMGLVVGALLLRVVLELLGLYFWWPQEGSRHVFQVMVQEFAELTRDLRRHPLRNEALVCLEYGRTRLVNNTEWMISLLRPMLPANTLPDIMYTLTWAQLSFVARLLRLIITIPLFLLCAIAGLTEGLVQRNLRRFGVGNESIFIHRSVRVLGTSTLSIYWLFYLAQPMLWSSELYLLPAALWTGIALCVGVDSFKRWL
ncbi:TPA: DUF4400 domain-containing protein [Salmonella enterica subsp. salamae serovar 35:g,m,s,t:-]|nr:DUF4400 domain-containing protein [Salmonella enterica subsp. salamae serovar 35:g,m,s,t:-]HCA3418914.1 DUF4400 domain-containing protein [Salmonella enterica subsp. salamae serovar 35:g,m,s,t:-]HCA3428081.1 DUF4400 domain-containing protein [Salmonella enterica subsp. salamae serovar 35:g,m,s,t:-]HCA3437718.1 DUF4400 domain-containing protein [Salmonella enterica subsp. salamae serovar 35:g,m,s,t:-]HCA3442224.1 DUF4400 domain-containing protein [Salmonella enterica subsp. salamae serovar 35